MTCTAEEYLSTTLELAHTAAETQLDAIRAAAVLVADAVRVGRTWWTFGSGHSHLIAEELYGRAGGLVAVRAILEPSLMLHESLIKSSLFERRTGIAADLLDVHPVTAGDVVLIASNSGRNAVPVEFATGCRERGARVIALTSLRHSKATTSRAPSGAKLFEVADVVIDNGGVVGDAVINTEHAVVGPTSSVIGCLLVNAIVAEVVGKLEGAGTPVEVLTSLNV